MDTLDQILDQVKLVQLIHLNGSKIKLRPATLKACIAQTCRRLQCDAHMNQLDFQKRKAVFELWQKLRLDRWRNRLSKFCLRHIAAQQKLALFRAKERERLKRRRSETLDRFVRRHVFRVRQRQLEHWPLDHAARFQAAEARRWRIARFYCDRWRSQGLTRRRNEALRTWCRRHVFRVRQRQLEYWPVGHAARVQAAETRRWGIARRYYDRWRSLGFARRRGALLHNVIKRHVKKAKRYMAKWNRQRRAESNDSRPDAPSKPDTSAEAKADNVINIFTSREHHVSPKALSLCRHLTWWFIVLDSNYFDLLVRSMKDGGVVNATGWSEQTAKSVSAIASTKEWIADIYLLRSVDKIEVVSTILTCVKFMQTPEFENDIRQSKAPKVHRRKIKQAVQFMAAISEAILHSVDRLVKTHVSSSFGYYQANDILPFERMVLDDVPDNVRAIWPKSRGMPEFPAVPSTFDHSVVASWFKRSPRKSQHVNLIPVLAQACGPERGRKCL